MANKNILTYNAIVTEVEQMYYAPVVVSPVTGLPLTSFYCFLAHADNWVDDTNPDQPTETEAYLKSVYKNIFVAKQITTNDISPVIQRNDWTANTVYDYYSDTADMFATDVNGVLVKTFYVRNRYDQVFKCLWNNNGGVSSYEPMFQPGTYGTNNIYQNADGYKWKYIYTIDAGRKTKFMDSSWMPVPVINTTFDPNATTAGAGDIEVINVVNGGHGYDPVNAAITITITGDGVGASANVVTSNGSIIDVLVSFPGTDYSYANVSITSALGSNASIVAPISPIGGHGYDAVTELGCSRVMITCQFTGSENGHIPTSNLIYHQVGLLVNPLALSTYPNLANASIYKTSTDFIVASGFGSYISDEKIYQGTSLSSATFSATVLNFDSSNNIICLINTTGTLSFNAPVFGNTSGTARTLLNINSPDLILFSGKINYIENRSGIQRSSDGIEQFKYVIQF